MILVFFSYTLPPSSSHTLLHLFTHTFPFIILFSQLCLIISSLSLIRLSISKLSFHLFFVRLLPVIYLFASCFSSVWCLLLTDNYITSLMLYPISSKPNGSGPRFGVPVLSTEPSCLILWGFPLPVLTVYFCSIITERLSVPF